MEVRGGLWCLARSHGCFVAFEQIMDRMGSALEHQGGDMQGTRSLVWKYWVPGPGAGTYGKEARLQWDI